MDARPSLFGTRSPDLLRKRALEDGEVTEEGSITKKLKVMDPSAFAQVPAFGSSVSLFTYTPGENSRPEQLENKPQDDFTK